MARELAPSVVPTPWSPDAVVLEVIGDTVDLGPLLEKCKWFRLHYNNNDNRREILGTDAPKTSVIAPLFALMLCFHKVGHGAAEWLLFQLVRWFQFTLEITGWHSTLSFDWLDHPMTVGNSGRSRRIPTPLKMAVAREGASAAVVRSCAQLMKVLHRITKVAPGVSGSTANQFASVYCSQYLGRMKIAFEGAECKFFSLAFDETRLSGLGALFAAIYSPSLNLAGWCPPMATFRYHLLLNCFIQKWGRFVLTKRPFFWKRQIYFWRA